MSGGAPTHSNSLHRRIERLEQELSQFRTRLAERLAQPSLHRDLRLAITVNYSYPSSSGTGHMKVPIKFLDATFSPATPGWANSLTTQTREDSGETHQAVAANIESHQFIPVGTIVWALWQRPIKSLGTAEDGEWWVMRTSGGGMGSKIGKPKTTNHSPDTWHTYTVWQLGSSAPSSTSEEIEVWNETGQTLSKDIMHIIWEVNTNSSNADQKWTSLPLELEACV